MSDSDSSSSASGLKSTLDSLYGTTCLYSVIGASKNANANELKKAYHAKSLVHHPDREGGDKETFQALGAVYKLLSDKDRRAVYDDTGEIDEGEDTDINKDWDQYWRLLFKVGTNAACNRQLLRCAD
jgi:DnaJ family protein C protein 9